MAPATRSKQSLNESEAQNEVTPPIRLKQMIDRTSRLGSDWPKQRLNATNQNKNKIVRVPRVKQVGGTSDEAADWPCLGTRARRRLSASQRKTEVAPAVQLPQTISGLETKLEYPCLGTRSRRKFLSSQLNTENTFIHRGRQQTEKENVLDIQDEVVSMRTTRSMQKFTPPPDCKEKLHSVILLNQTPKSSFLRNELAPKSRSKKKVNTVYAPRKEVAHISLRSKRKLYKAQVCAERELVMGCCSGLGLQTTTETCEMQVPSLVAQRLSEDNHHQNSPVSYCSEADLVSKIETAVLKNKPQQPEQTSKLNLIQELNDCQPRTGLNSSACSSNSISTTAHATYSQTSLLPTHEENSSKTVVKTATTCNSPAVSSKHEFTELETVDLPRKALVPSQEDFTVKCTSKQKLAKLLTSCLKEKLNSQTTYTHKNCSMSSKKNSTDKNTTSITELPCTQHPSQVQEQSTAESCSQLKSAKSTELQSVLCLKQTVTQEQEEPVACCSTQKLITPQARKQLTAILASGLKQKLNGRPVQVLHDPDMTCSKKTTKSIQTAEILTVNLACRLKEKLNMPLDKQTLVQHPNPDIENNSDVGQLATETLAFRLKQIIKTTRTHEESNAKYMLGEPGPSTSPQYLSRKRKISEDSEMVDSREGPPLKRCKSCNCTQESSYVNSVKYKSSLNTHVSATNKETNLGSNVCTNTWDMPSTSKCNIQEALPEKEVTKDLMLPKMNREHSKDSILKRLETVLMATFRKRFTCTPSIPDTEPVEPVRTGSNAVGPSNFMTYQYINQRTLGSRSTKIVLEPVFSPVVNHLSQLTVYKTASPFDRRATAMAWHPTCPSSLAVASKGGDIILWNFESARHDLFIPGIGAGGSILAMKFHAHDPTLLYTAALDGKVCLQDFQGKNSRIILDTMNWDQWFCSLDVSFHERMLVAGDSLGNVTLMTNYGEKAWSFRLHRSKVSHVEFSPRESWLLATTSIDSTLKIWDIRNVKNRDSALHVCRHDKPVNSAYFSLQNGTRILTTDQHSELRIYKAPLWNLERVIPHPHRQFQHLTPIKAHWHPLVDVAVVGRYPDEHFPGYVPGERRSVDFFSAETGNMSFQLTEQGVVGIISLNQFNNTGEVLASCMGYNILIWKNKDDVTAQRLLQHQNSAKQVRYFKTTFYQRPQRSRQDENNSSGMNVNHQDNNNNNGNNTGGTSNGNNTNCLDLGKRKFVRSLLVDNKNLNTPVC